MWLFHGQHQPATVGNVTSRIVYYGQDSTLHFVIWRKEMTHSSHIAVSWKQATVG